MTVDLPAFFRRAIRPPASVAAVDRATTPARARWVRPAWVGPLALVALIVFFRTPGAWLDPQFFQEDGSVFFGQNHLHGWRAILMPYAGYLDVIMRLVAWVAGFWPLILQPALFHAAAVALCLAVVARIMRPTIRLPHKTLLAVAVVLVPRGGGGEILGNLTNVQWFLALVPVLMLVEDTAPTGWRAAWDLCQLALVGLSGPFVLISIPLFAVKWVRVARSHWNASCLGVALVCGVVQAWFIHRQPPSPATTPTVHEWLTYLAWKPIGPLFLGKELSVRCLAPGAALAMLVGLGILLMALTLRRPAWRWPTTVFAAFGSCVFVASISRFVRAPAVFLPVDNVDRYFFLPRLLLLWCLLLHLGGHTGWLRWLVRALLVFATIAAAADFDCSSLPDSDWTQQVAAFEHGETATLRNYPTWRIFVDQPSNRADDYADVLGEVPLRIVPVDEGTRVLIGAEPFLQPRSAAGGLIYEAPAQARAVTGRYAAAPGTDGVVEFSILYLAANQTGSQVLWQRRLDPGHVPADRAARSFDVALPPDSIGRLILRSRPAPGETSGGGCWAYVHFR